MRVKILTGKSADSIAWNVVKGWLVVVLVWVALPPITTGFGVGTQSGLKTVLAGRISATKIVPVTLDFSSRAISVAVKPGDAVVAGQLLAVLESGEVEELLLRSRRRLEMAAARLKPLPNTPLLLWQEQFRSATQQSQEARVRLTSFNPEQAEAVYARAVKEVATMKSVVQQRLATAQDLDAAIKQLDMAEANLEQARNTRTRLQHEVRAADSQLRIAQLQKPQSTTLADSSAQLEYDEALRGLELAQRKKRALRVVAPQAGTILTVSIEPGSEAGGWAPMFQIADLTTLQVEVPVTSRLAQMIPVGTPVDVVIPGDPPKTVPASVGILQLVPDQRQSSHIVRIPVRNPGLNFVALGLECSVEFYHGGKV